MRSRRLSRRLRSRRSAGRFLRSRRKSARACLHSMMTVRGSWVAGGLGRGSAGAKSVGLGVGAVSRGAWRSRYPAASTRYLEAGARTSVAAAAKPVWMR